MIINGENDQKLFIFEPKWYIFGKKWWKFMQKSMFKIAHIWMKWLKSNWFYQCKKWSKTWKNYHFHPFLCNFTICMWTTNKLLSIFYMRKIGKNYVKKHVKNGKSRNFEKVLKSSIRLQITFWIAEKIAIEYLTWNPKNHENS